MVLGSNRDTPSGTDLLRPSNIDFETLVKLGNEAIVLIGLDGTPAFVSPQPSACSDGVRTNWSIT